MQPQEGSVTISRQQRQVVVYANDIKMGIAFDWSTGDAFARTIRRMSNNQMPHDPYAIDANVTIRREAQEIIVEWQGRVFHASHLEVACTIANAVTVKCREIEEELEAEHVIADEALNFRGALMPFGLTGNPVLRKAAEQEAAWGKEPRRYLPNKIDTSFHAYPPSVKQLTPDAPWQERLANMTEDERRALEEALDA